MGVKWDSSELRRMRERLAVLASGAFRRDIYRLLAEEAHHLVRNEFRKEMDPYGKAWKPIKRPGKILQDTGRLRNSYSANATHSGFEIATDVKYAAIHNFGGHITRQARVNAHGRKGRFIARGKGRGRSQRVSFTAAHSFTMPQRQMVPDPKHLPKAWGQAFGEVVRDALKSHFRGIH